VIGTADGNDTLLYLSQFIGDTKNRQRKLRSMASELGYAKQAFEEAKGKQGTRLIVFFILYGEAILVSV
jgi:hypothetical protein